MKGFEQAWRKVVESMPYDLIDKYTTLESAGLEPGEYKTCTECKRKPMVWIFDNGCYAACACFSIYSKKVKSISVLEVFRRDGNTNAYKQSDLMRAWNKFVYDRKLVR